MKIPIIFGLVFPVCLLVIELVFYAYRAIRNPDREKVRRRLRALASMEHGDDVPDILRNSMLSDVPLLNGILVRIPGIQRLELYVRQANVSYRLGFFILLTIVLALIGLTASYHVTKTLVVSVAVAAVLGMCPFLYVRVKRTHRMQKFHRQLPDSLDLIARALRAGHAFSSGMKLAADEFDDPLGTEFQETVDEINFGNDVPGALKNLARRVDCPDVKYFVVSVIIQRETGGNLAEIIEKIAHLIRERFKLQGKIRVLSAEGRLSAGILILIPFVFVTAIHFLNPGYISTLFSDPIGRMIAGSAVVMMAIGVFVIKRMIAFKV